MSDEINEKMEQIRLKNEELEKKHQEILQDEAEAKKQGALVSKSQAISTKTTEKHRYDNVELDYDVKDEEKELAKNPDYKPKNRRPILGKKQLDEIPPDPVNFLRDDGDSTNAESQQNRRPQQNNNNRNRNNPRNQRPREAANNDYKSGDASGPRQKNPNYRPRPQQNNNQNNRNFGANDAQQAVNRDNNSNSPRKTHPQQLRTERRSAQGTESNTESNADPNKATAQQQNRPRRPNNDNRPRPKSNKEKIEGKNDITVEVTDEVRSVKLKTSEKTFGTGRVRPSTDNYDNEGNNEKNQSPEGNGSNRKHNRSHHNRKYDKRPKGPPQPEFQHPILDKIVITKTSVQDRLLRSKMMDEKDQEEPKIDTEPSAVPVESVENVENVENE